MIARSAGVQGISMMVMFPLTFLSNAFVPAQTLPGGLETFVTINPVSAPHHGHPIWPTTAGHRRIG